MTNKQLIRTTCIVGGLIGAGILVYRFNRPSPKIGSIPEGIKLPDLAKQQAIVTPSSIPDPKGKASGLAPVVATIPESKESGSEQEKSQPKPTFPLQKGSRSKAVERLQIWLLRNHGWKGTITGEYDSQTEALVQKSLHRSDVDQSTYKKHKMGTPIYQQYKRK